MRILAYSETNSTTVRSNLGLPEYSYFFILDKYRPVLDSIGELIEIRNPEEEVDKLYEEAQLQGEPCVFLSFTPPHRITVGLRCPTVCVLAWEYDSIPDENWNPDEECNNWAETLSRIGHVITISDFATSVIRRQVAPGTVVTTVPAPVVQSPTSFGLVRSLLDRVLGKFRYPGSRQRSINLNAAVIDSRDLEIDTNGVRPRTDQSLATDRSALIWDGHSVSWNFSSEDGRASQYLVGFYDAEGWGAWSKTALPSVMLPWQIRGPFELEIALVGYAENQGRTIQVRLGKQQREIVVTGDLVSYRLEFDLDNYANSLHFDGVVARAATGTSIRDSRSLGIGLVELKIRRPAHLEYKPSGGHQSDETIIADQSTVLDLSGTIYTSVFNPMDGRKNWQDIATAFCWAFREDPDKTLILKMSHHNRSTFISGLWLLLSGLSPFQCRIVVIHGFLSDEELYQLIGLSDFFVNASVAEGQCLPLLEFMSQGVPAIAPSHTAMSDYISTDNALVIKSSLQPAMWPMDPRQFYRTLSHRIDWDHLRQTYLDSAQLINERPAEYRRMAKNARKTAWERYSTASISGPLVEALTGAIL